MEPASVLSLYFPLENIVYLLTKSVWPVLFLVSQHLGEEAEVKSHSGLMEFILYGRKGVSEVS